MKPYLLLITLLMGCEKKPYVIYQKLTKESNPCFCIFEYSSNGGFNIIQSVDSCSKFEVGDDIRKYSNNPQHKPNQP